MKRSASLALLLTPCTGSVSRGLPGGGNGPATGSSGPGGGPGPGGVPVATIPHGSACGAPDLPKARTWRLTNAQFRNPALAAFGFMGPTTDTLPPDGEPEAIATQAARLSVQPLLASKYFPASDEI